MGRVRPVRHSSRDGPADLARCALEIEGQQERVVAFLVGNESDNPRRGPRVRGMGRVQTTRWTLTVSPPQFGGCYMARGQF